MIDMFLEFEAVALCIRHEGVAEEPNEAADGTEEKEGQRMRFESALLPVGETPVSPQGDVGFHDARINLELISCESALLLRLLHGHLDGVPNLFLHEDPLSSKFFLHLIPNFLDFLEDPLEHLLFLRKLSLSAD